MHVEVFSLCDAATVDAGGKLNILGAFDTLWAPQLPLVYPQMAIALRLRFSQIEGGTHDIAVNFVDADGKAVLAPARGTITLQFPVGQRSCSANSVLNVQMLNLGKYGEYALDLIIDGQPRATLPFFVIKPPGGNR